MSSVITVVLIDSDPSVRALVRHTLQMQGGGSEFFTVIAETENPAYGYELIRQHCPQVVFMDVLDAKSFDILQRIGTYFKDVMVVASGDDLTLQTVMQCMQAGAREYLRRPLIADEITAALQRHRGSLGRSGADETGRLIAVFSNKGGLGKTTIAVNTAMALSEVIQSEAMGKPVALVDFNLQLGDITTFLDIQPKQTVVDVIKNLARVDEEYLRASLTPFNSGPVRLSVLADPTNMEEADDITPDQLATLVAMLKATFPYVVVDLGSTLDARTIAVLDQADTILLTSMMNLPCIRNTQRMLGLFNRLGYDKHKIRLIINRYVPSDEITLEDVEQTLKTDVFWQFPNNYFAVIASINRGLPLRTLDNGKDLYNSFIGLARQLAGISIQQSIASVTPQLNPAKKKNVSKDNAIPSGGFASSTSVLPKSSASHDQKNVSPPSLWGLLGQTLQRSITKSP
ncbi:MAG: AAA family ATPase [Vampirovibrionales bacterium]|nr:AAA family ATPase [Vampirovibrionales bacterium]